MFDFFQKKKEIDNKINEYKKSKIEATSMDEFVDQDSEMLLLFGDCEPLTKKIKLLLVSDTHNGLDELRFADYVYRYNEYDACILLGNSTDKDLAIIKKYIDNKKLYSITNAYKDIKCIDGKIIRINGVNILGLGKHPATQKNCLLFFESKDKADVLITYDNRFTTIDGGGYFGINYYIYKNKVSHHIHGGLLKQYKDTMPNGTKEISTYDFEYVELPIE